MSVRRIVVGCTAAALAVATGVGVTTATASSPTLRGPDVSSHQHPNGELIYWGHVRRAGSSFAFIKATEGSTYRNPYFARDYADAHTSHLIRSAYHYARPTSSLSSATAQADYLVEVAGRPDHQGDLPLTLDLEESGGLSPSQLVSWTSTFVKRVQRRTGRAPIIYSYPYFWYHNMGNTTAFRAFPLWIADYRSGGPSTPLPGGWSTWTFWQYTSQARTDGISTIVDMSVFHGSQTALQRLATPPAPGKKPVTPTPTPSPTPPRPPVPLPSIPVLHGRLVPQTPKVRPTPPRQLQHLPHLSIFSNVA